jgi:hypothetical protein
MPVGQRIQRAREHALAICLPSARLPLRISLLVYVRALRAHVVSLHYCGETAMTAQSVYDPYAPPGAIVADPAPASYGDFRRISTWWIIPLTIITLGVYPSYWLYSRVKTLNALSTTEAIAEGLPLAGLLLNAGNLIAAFVSVAYPDLIGIPLIALFVKLAFFIVNLVCVFSFRDELHEHPTEYSERSYHLSGLATFFLQVPYLNYKLNQRIDAARTAIRPAAMTGRLVPNSV